QRVGGQGGRVGGGVFGLNADDADLTPELLGARLHGNGNTGEEPAAANAHDDRVHIGHLVQDFQADGPLPGHHVNIVERVYEHGPGLVGVALGLGQRFVDVVP